MIRWAGIREFRRHIDDADRMARKALAAELFREGQETMTESKPLVPVDLGTLRNSGTVFEPEFDQGRVSVSLGYGGAASDYALVQHERTDYTHTVGQAKYLEAPAKARAQGFGKRIAAGVARRLRASR